MDVCLYFNELSLFTKADSKENAKSLMENFISVVSKLCKSGAKRELNINADFYQQDLYQGYSISDWKNDYTADRDSKRYLNSLLTKFTSIEELQPENQPAEYDFLYNNKPADGLGKAYLDGGIGVSIHTSDEWDNEHITISVKKMDDSLELSESDYTVNHCSKTEHAISKESWIKTVISGNIRTGEDLWKNRNLYYDKLIFCHEVEKNLKQITDLKTVKQINIHLLHLQKYCEQWTSGTFDNCKIPEKITPESKTTLEKFGQEHTFTSPDNSKIVFSYHSRFTPGDGRIFFEPEHSTRQILVGYIGPKLPTVKYPT